MGSAVVKPLTRRRGKIKKNKVDVNPANGNEEENVTGNCKPSVNYKVNSQTDSAKNIRQSFFGKPCKVDVDNTHSNRKVCCTYVFLSGRNKSYDSDEELCQKHTVRKNTQSPSQTKNSPNNVTHHSDNHKNVPIPSPAAVCTARPSPSGGTPSDKCEYITPVSIEVNKFLDTDCVSLLKLTECPKNKLIVPGDAAPDNKIVILEKGRITEKLNPAEHDASKTIRTPPLEYSDVNKSKAFKHTASLTDKRAALSCFERCEHSSETNVFPTGEVSVSLSNTEQPVYGHKSAHHNLETDYSTFIDKSSFKEYVGSQKHIPRESIPVQLSRTHEVFFIKPEIKPYYFETECEDIDFDNDYNSKPLHQCLAACKTSPGAESSTSVKMTNSKTKMEADITLECNENNAIHSIDSCGDVFKEILHHVGSNRSSSTSLNIKAAITKSNKRCDSMLNNPHIEEVLAVGEEFVDEIGGDFLPRSKIQSPRMESAKYLTSIQETECRENPQLLSWKAKDDVHGTSLSMSSGFSASSVKNSEVNRGQFRSRPGSGAETSSILSDTFHIYNNTCTIRPLSRPTSASNQLRPQNSNEAFLHYKPFSSEQTQMKSDIPNETLSIDNLMHTDNRVLPRTYSSKESLQCAETIQSHSTLNTTKQTQSLSDTPLVTSAITTVNVASYKCTSRPPSSRRTLVKSEQNGGLSKPPSCKQFTSLTESAPTNGMPQSVQSRHNFNASRPPSGIGRLLQSGIEICNSDERLSGAVVLTRSRTSNHCIVETVFTGGSDDLLKVIEPDPVNYKSLKVSPTSAAFFSTTELTARSPPNACSIGSPSRWKTVTHVEAIDGVSSFDHCCLPGSYTRSNQATKSHSKSSTSSKICTIDEQEEPCQETSVPKKTPSQSKLHQSLINDGTKTETRGSTTKINNDEKPSDETRLSLPPTTAQPYCLSPDKIGNIRKQLYEEGLKPAEREGGVAFFIPVTEDGLLPQIDGAIVAERLTKTKKASLNYEERMFLANINRQVQLSKKKEFAIRDIRNVKGATSSSDGSDRTKQNEDVDDFDVPF